MNGCQQGIGGKKSAVILSNHYRRDIPSLNNRRIVFSVHAASRKNADQAFQTGYFARQDALNFHLRAAGARHRKETRPLDRSRSTEANSVKVDIQ